MILFKAASSPSSLIKMTSSSSPPPSALVLNKLLNNAHSSPPTQWKDLMREHAIPPPPPLSSASWMSPRLAKKLRINHHRLGRPLCFCKGRSDFEPLVVDELKHKHKKDRGGSYGEEALQSSTMLKQPTPTWSLMQHIAMAHKEAEGGGGGGGGEKESKKLVFFDVETTVPTRSGQGYQLLEFAAVVLDTRGLGELLSFHTLVCPKDPSSVTRRTTDCNGITRHTVADAPAFADVAHDIYSILHGHIWAGHNILKFDNLRIQEAFSEIGHPPPQPSGIVDTYPLLKKTFGKRAGNYKLESLANYCGYGKQEHRSLADVRMNVDVLRSCATLMFLESNFPHIFPAQQSESPVSRSASKQSTILSRSVVKYKGEVSESAGNGSMVESKYASNSSLTGREYGSSNKKIKGHQSCSTSIADVASEKDGNVVSLSNGLENDTGDEILKTYEDANGNESDMKEQQANSLHATADIVATMENSIEDGDSLPEALHKEGDTVNHIFSREHYAAVCNAYEAALSDDLQKYLTVEDRAKNMLAHEGARQNVNADVTLTDHNSMIDNSIPETLQKDGDVDNEGENELAEASMIKDESSSQCPPFLLPGSIDLAAIEVLEELSSLGGKKILSYKGYPLQLMEFKAKIKFTVNPWYAFDEKGRPRFSILIELSKEALEVICKCEDLVRNIISSETRDIEWLPALRNDMGAWAARMSIGTKGIGSLATYTTKFYRSASDGLQEILIDPVNASMFKDVIPHGSIVNVGFGFYTFHVNNRAGVRLLANHITIL